MTALGRPRSFPYVWPTWVSGLLSGDKQCWWAAWFRAHYEDFEKLPAANGDRRAQWRAEHTVLVRQTADALIADGWDVTVEDQNKLNVKGETARVGGKPDIVAVNAIGQARIVDCKTGKPRESDYWQVVTYIALTTLPRARLAGMAQVEGVLDYGDGERRLVLPSAEAIPLVWGAVRKVAAADAPPRVPSAEECRYCDIAGCPDRVTEDAEAVPTEAF